MSRWDDRLINHPIHKLIADIETAIEAITDVSEAEDVIELRRFKKAIEFIKSVVNNLDGEITPLQLLDNVYSTLQNQGALSHLNAYISQKTRQYLVNANEALNDALIHTSYLIANSKNSPSDKSKKTYEKSFDDLIKLVDKKQNELEAKHDALLVKIADFESRFNDLSLSVSTKRTETDSLLATWQEQFSNAQEKRNQDFASDQKVRTDSFNEWKKLADKETKDKIQLIVDSNKTTLDTNQSNFIKKLEELLSEAKTKHSAIMELYNLVAGDSVAAAYIKNADDEKNAANFWRWATIFFILVTAAWTWYSYFHANQFVVNDIKNTISIVDWTRLIKAFSLTGILLFAAGYSARQSNQHRQNEKRTRWFALEVKAIDPFIASLSEDEQRALKNKLSEKLFGQNNFALPEKDTSLIDENSFGIVMKNVIDLAKALK